MLAQNLDDLLLRESALTHVRLPQGRTLLKNRGVYVKQVTPPPK